MGYELYNIVPWGRSYDEYVRMFDLSDADLNGRILDCAAGPASFVAKMHRRGKHAIACDPIYRYSVDEIRHRIDETYEIVIDDARKQRHKFVWTEQIPDPDVLGRIRMAAMQRFLADYPEGLRQGRYVPDALPKLSFADQSFDLAICSHCLFLYSGRLTLDFHIAAIREMCRVASEARIFPILDFAGRPSMHIDGVREKLLESGCEVRIAPVPYEFQKGGNQMMVVRIAGT